MSVEVKTTFKPTIEAASAWREETNLPKLNKNGLWKKLFHLFQIHIFELWKIFNSKPSMAGGNIYKIYSSPTVY